MIALCAVDAIGERQARAFSIGATNLFALKCEGVIYVYRNSCPHLGVELNWQGDVFFDRDGQLLQCATHGALFVPETGHCVAGPCRGQYLQPIAAHIENGIIYVQP